MIPGTIGSFLIKHDEYAGLFDDPNPAKPEPKGCQTLLP